MNQTFISITSCLVLSIISVAFLFFVTEETVHRRNSFLRQFPPHTIGEGNLLDIKYNSYYIAGGTEHHFYFGNTTAPLHVLVANKTLADTQHVKLNIKNIEAMKFWSIKVKVDSPNFYMSDGTVPVVFSGKVNEWYGDRHIFDRAFFIDSTPISARSYAIRAISSSTKEYELGKIKSDPPHISIAPNLLEKQIDGRFCVDGMMQYDKETNRLVYVYFYRNQYIVMDTNMHLINRGNTIDTVTRAKLKVASIASDNSSNLAAPPLLVNKRSCVVGDLLLVNSNLLAKNEDIEIFKNASVIDVYSLTAKEYQFSFYIPDYNGKKLKDFMIFGDRLVVLFDHYVRTYSLIPYYFHNQSD